MPQHSATVEDQTRGATNAERRRPGRAEYPALIALLRDTPTDAAEPDVDTEEDGLASAKGLMLGLPLGVVLWAGIAAVAWLVIG